MSTTKINEQLAFLRKQNKVTQEELANFLGVTNQSVSKWESGMCCPDIGLLPKIASYFHVSVDELLGYKPTDNFNDIYLKIKSLFKESPSDISFDLAYKLSFIIHEGAVSKGYKAYIPWDADKIRSSDKDFYKWGFSACSEPEGTSVMKDNTVLISSHKYHQETDPNELMAVCSEIQKYSDIDRLTAFLTLYELTRKNLDLFVNIKDISEKSKMSEDKIREAFKWLPIHHKRLDDGSFGYRIEGSNMHIPVILMLLIK